MKEKKVFIVVMFILGDHDYIKTKTSLPWGMLLWETNFSSVVLGPQ